MFPRREVKRFLFIKRWRSPRSILSESVAQAAPLKWKAGNREWLPLCRLMDIRLFFKKSFRVFWYSWMSYIITMIILYSELFVSMALKHNYLPLVSLMESIPGKQVLWGWRWNFQANSPPGPSDHPQPSDPFLHLARTPPSE